jgi:hypothetical protein
MHRAAQNQPYNNAKTSSSLKNGVFWVVTPCGSWFLQEPYGVTTQKTSFFIVTAVKTSNLTSSSLLTGYQTIPRMIQMLDEMAESDM